MLPWELTRQFPSCYRMGGVLNGEEGAEKEPIYGLPSLPAKDAVIWSFMGNKTKDVGNLGWDKGVNDTES